MKIKRAILIVAVVGLTVVNCTKKDCGAAKGLVLVILDIAELFSGVLSSKESKLFKIIHGLNIVAKKRLKEKKHRKVAWQIGINKYKNKVKEDRNIDIKVASCPKKERAVFLHSEWVFWDSTSRCFRSSKKLPSSCNEF